MTGCVTQPGCEKMWGPGLFMSVAVISRDHEWEGCVKSQEFPGCSTLGHYPGVIGVERVGPLTSCFCPLMAGSLEISTEPSVLHECPGLWSFPVPPGRVCDYLKVTALWQQLQNGPFSETRVHQLGTNLIWATTGLPVMSIEWPVPQRGWLDVIFTSCGSRKMQRKTWCAWL